MRKKKCSRCQGTIDLRGSYWHLTQQGGVFLCDKCGWDNMWDFMKKKKEEGKNDKDREDDKREVR